MTDAQILRQIGTNIRAARIAANMTQEGLAELADIHWKTLGYIEAGKRDFGVTTLTRLALCLRLAGDELWQGVKAEPTRHLSLVARAMTRKRRPKKADSGER